MSEAMRRVKQQMLVAADEYEAEGDVLRAGALRLLVEGQVASVHVAIQERGLSMHVAIQKRGLNEVTLTVTLHQADVMEVARG